MPNRRGNNGVTGWSMQIRHDDGTTSWVRSDSLQVAPLEGDSPRCDLLVVCAPGIQTVPDRPCHRCGRPLSLHPTSVDTDAPTGTMYVMPRRPPDLRLRTRWLWRRLRLRVRRHGL